MAQKSGDFYTYDKTVRALIIKRDQGQVQTIEDLKKLLRYNKYQTDPLSHGKASWAIDSRYDIEKNKMFGATDAKVISARRVWFDQSAIIQSGPTHDD